MISCFSVYANIYKYQELYIKADYTSRVLLIYFREDTIAQLFK